MIAALVVAALSWVVAPSPCYLRPVDAAVVDPFREPACRWCPGNRGLEYATTPGAPVVAVAAGTVTFAGVVAGVRYVVVRHADGRLATYGRLRTTVPRAGDPVMAGGRVGTALDRFHFGLRDKGRYIDPAPWLGEPWSRPVLVPADGSPGRVAPAGSCPVERALRGRGR